ncbi:uncharacterized protein RHO17_008793 isoform 2-T2 [Thomomys bottae]
MADSGGPHRPGVPFLPLEPSTRSSCARMWNRLERSIMKFYSCTHLERKVGDEIKKILLSSVSLAAALRWFWCALLFLQMRMVISSPPTPEGVFPVCTEGTQELPTQPMATAKVVHVVPRGPIVKIGCH